MIYKDISDPNGGKVCKTLDLEIGENRDKT